MSISTCLIRNILSFHIKKTQIKSNYEFEAISNTNDSHSKSYLWNVLIEADSKVCIDAIWVAKDGVGEVSFQWELKTIMEDALY